MRQLLFLFCFLVCAGQVLAQQQSGSIAADPQKRLVYFTDKANSPYTLQQPLQYLTQKAIERRLRQNIPLKPRDLPVNPAYVAGLKQLSGVTVWYTSKWFNAAVVQCTDEKMAEIQALSYVKSSTTLNGIALSSSDAQLMQEPRSDEQQRVQDGHLTPAAYGLSFDQAKMIGAVELHNKGYSGQNMTIAVMDSGFPGVNTLPAFSHLFQNNKIQGTYDFVSRTANAYVSDGHGTAVLSTMAAYLPEQYIGTAYNADYLLFRTEDVASEHKIEEINWLLAAEYADSAGADVINSSVGYNTFQAPSPSYTYNDMNGNTALVTRAADYAAATGMLVVASAGNSGAAAWRYITAPADADSVLTVGSVDKAGVRAASSSVGPTADGRIKPDVVALGQGAYAVNATGNITSVQGTSFSGPIVAGMAAALWQANPGSTSQEIIRMIRQSGTNAANPDMLTGYGIPNYNRIVTSVPKAEAEGIYITNPVTSHNILLTLSDTWIKQPTVLQVFDITGRLVYHEVLPPRQYNHHLQLQPHALKQGVYLCRLSSGNNRSMLRFMKL